MSLALADLAGATDTKPVVATIDLVPGSQSARTLSALVVHADDGWTALCEEIEVAADGDTATEAFENLRRAVEAVLEVDSIDSRPQTPARDVLALIDRHTGPAAIEVFIFPAPK